MKRLVARGLVLILALAGAPAAAAPSGQAQKDVVFTDYPPLASVAEIMRRNLTPLAMARQLDENQRSGLGPPPDAAFDVSQERFAVYVPPVKPPGGYGLLVFVPPFENAEVPRLWTPVLDQFGVILVSAARSGNDDDTANRRVPLAVAAAVNVMKLYPVDASKVFVSGVSGGSQVAMRLAVAYPDLFHGALLNAGSDVLGDAGEAVPPRDLLYQFQTSSRLIYVTGADDSANLPIDAASRYAMRAFCMFNIETDTITGMGHDIAPPAALADSLKFLLAPIKTDAGKLAACRAKLDAEMDAKFQKVEALLAGGKHDAAMAALADIDHHYGGLAAPRSTDLAAK